jgi:ParB family chromosome partitioning protein
MAAKRKPRVAAGSRGLAPREAVGEEAPEEVAALREAIEEDGGAVVGAYREPLGSHWVVLAALPIERVKPTPFQRDLSATHVERLGRAIQTLDRFLDPVVAVRTDAGEYWVPNGYHRSEAMRKLGAKTVTALVLPDSGVAYQILALNTEKAHNLREKSLEVIRMARTLADLDPRPESAHATTFEEAAFLTLGVCYEERPRFSGSVYHPVLKRVDGFLPDRLPRALGVRAARAKRLFALDDAVLGVVRALEERGFKSPYLKSFVLARVNPLRWQKAATGPFDATIERMTAAAKDFDVAKVKPGQIAATGGPPPE